MTETASDALASLGASVDDQLERVRVPIYLLDAAGTVQWLNPAAKQLVGDWEGRAFLELVVPSDRARAEAAFQAKILRRIDSTELTVVIRRLGGVPVPVEIHSVAVTDGSRVVGVFGIAQRTPAEGALELRRPPHLTLRQYETLALLGHGASTDQIATTLGVAKETARNHIRAVLRELSA